MKRAALIQNGFVADVILVDEIPPGYVECPAHVGIGLTVDAAVPPPSPREIADEAKRTEIAQAMEAARADAFVRQFVNMTPAQVADYVNGNVSNLTDARNLLIKLALMMLALAKEQYK
jgi:hypothetical protein